MWHVLSDFRSWLATAKPETVVAVLTAAVSVWVFLMQQRQASRRPFLEKQLQISVEATDAASRLATATDPDEWERARQEFWQLYWGRLALVEDRAVEARMVEFGRLIPEGPITRDQLPLTDLSVPSLLLAHAARAMVAKSWRKDLATLPTPASANE
jgi:hypothetical protein